MTLFEIAAELVREIYPDKDAQFIKERVLTKWRNPNDSTRWLSENEVLIVLANVDVLCD